MKRKLVAALACRNNGSRLFAKPLQNLDEKKNLKVIDYLIYQLKKIPEIKSIVLGISRGKENAIYKDIAKKFKLKYIYGDETDVLSRLISCGQTERATDIFRVTTECPFIYLNEFSYHWKSHVNENFDATFLENIIDGCGYEIIKLESLKMSHKLGLRKHKSEMCSLYIRENINKFRINRVFPPKKLVRKDLRLTIDYPEDLIVCREVYKNVVQKSSKMDIFKIVNYLDKKKNLKNLLRPYVKMGYKIMYI